jgi:radical SAM superfamily enzyme YgiQ (UPF0313 family)
MPRPTSLQDAEGHEGQRSAPAAGGLRVRRRPDPAEHQEGLRTDIARRFTEDCRKLGILIHGTFILGLPGETTETIEKTINFAKEINPHTIQVSLAAPYPGTTLYKQAVDNGWLQENEAVNLVNDKGVQLAAISYPHLSKEEIFHSMEVFYKRFYFRPGKIWEIVKEMLASWEMMKRRLREGVEFFRFLRAHEAAGGSSKLRRPDYRGCAGLAFARRGSAFAATAPGDRAQTPVRRRAGSV